MSRLISFHGIYVVRQRAPQADGFMRVLIFTSQSGSDEGQWGGNICPVSFVHADPKVEQRDDSLTGACPPASFGLKSETGRASRVYRCDASVTDGSFLKHTHTLHHHHHLESVPQNAIFLGVSGGRGGGITKKTTKRFLFPYQSP